MPHLLALDVAILPPPDVQARAIALSATLPAVDGLRLSETCIPHVTLTQGFIPAEEVGNALDRVDTALRGERPFEVNVTGVGRSGHTIWMTVERSPKLVELHELLMDTLRGYERPGGTRAAFVGSDGRESDIAWVKTYRLKSALHSFMPHITLGHGGHEPVIEPFSFEASVIAGCQLGRFCTCQRVLRAWTLKKPEKPV